MLPEVRSPQLQLQELWRRVLLWGLPMVLVGMLFASLMGRNDAWDIKVDQLLYLLMGTLLSLGWLGLRFRLLPAQWMMLALLVSGGAFLLGKLALLGWGTGLGVSPAVFVQELGETLVWFPPLIIWAMLGELTASVRRLLDVLMALLALISLALILRSVFSWGIPLDQNALRVLVQLNLSCAVSLYGASYFLARSELIGRVQGERSAVSRLTYTDLLTGLPGRLSLDEQLQRLTAPFSQETGETATRPFALLFVDVDSFKVVNDTLGHAVGDEVLRGVADELRRLSGRNARVYRISGDEFVVLVLNVSGTDAELLAQRLQVEAAKVPSLTVGVQITLSVGVSVCPEDGVNPEELLRHADSAMYAVKRAGRRGVRRYHPQQDAATERIQVLARDLGHALAREELSLVFQPVYRLHDLQLVKAEALLRWTHGQLGPVSPAEFIPVAERSGQITPIGAWALRQAAQAAVGWPGVTVSVNVSAVQLVWSDFVKAMQDTLRETGLDAKRLELEVTETALLHEDDRAITALKALRRLGVQVSVDDFGSGYSNLTRLRSMPLSGVKLDRSITAEMLRGRQGEFARALTYAAVGIARHMGIDLTAEGIETPEQLSLLRTLGIALGQGYELGRPMPAAEFSALVKGGSTLASRLTELPTPVVDVAAPPT